MKSKRQLLLTTALALLTTLPLFAQAQGRVAGKVLDPSGEPLEGVKVTVSATDMDLSVEQTTNKKGRFVIAVVDATKDFTITLEKEGYATVREPVDPPIGDIIRKTWTLEPGSSRPTGSAAVPADQIQGSRAAVAVYNEGANAFNEGDMETALAKFQEAAELDPALTAAHQILTGIYIEREDYDAAAATSDALLALEPTNAVGLAARYDVLRHRGEPEAAESTLDALVEVDQGEQTLIRVFNAGVAAVREERVAEAIRRFEQALTINPDMIEAHGALGNLYFGEQQYDRSLHHAERILEIDPGNVKGLAIRYDAHRGLGDEEQIAASFAELKSAAPEMIGEAFFKEGFEAFQKGDAEGAINALTKVVAAQPDHARAHYNLGLAYASAGDLVKAKEHLQRFVELAPDDPEAAVAQEMIGSLN